MDNFSSALEIASALRQGELSPVELLEGCLSAVERLDAQINALVWRNDDQAKSEAAQWADRMARREPLPPFAGVPLPVKDLTPVAGWPVTLGSRSVPEGPSDSSALVVEMLRRAGFVLCGRTNTPECGSITVTENLRYGTTKNPWDLSRSPGGSSGGAGAAVASGMFPVAHGNDGGGSIRIPSSCCGLVGLKASRGRVPAVVAGWMGMATEGALCRTVGDSAAMLDCLAGPERTVWNNAPPPPRPFADEVGVAPGRLRVALIHQAPFGLRVGEGPRQALRRSGELLEAAGHLVQEVDLELISPQMFESFLAVVNSGLADYPNVDPERLEPHNAASYRAAQGVDSLALVRALAQLQEHSHQLLQRWGQDFDVLVTPTMAIEPPPAGSLLQEVHRHPEFPPEGIISMAIFTAVFNVTGQPAISVPVHWHDGLPIGVQLVGGPWGEAQLIRVASQLEEASPWAHRRPPE